jgi:hypothetical protein
MNNNNAATIRYVFAVDPNSVRLLIAQYSEQEISSMIFDTFVLEEDMDVMIQTLDHPDIIRDFQGSHIFKKIVLQLLNPIKSFIYEDVRLKYLYRLSGVELVGTNGVLLEFIFND